MPLENPFESTEDSTDQYAEPTGSPSNVTVSIDDITFDDEPGQFVDPGQETGIWTDYVIVNRYEKDYHRYMMPVTSPNGVGGGGGLVLGATVSFVQLGSPTLLWISDWTASKSGDAPDIPDPRVQNTDWILLDEYMEPEMVVVGADAVSPIYRISGTYVYGHQNPSPSMHENINYGRPPWLQDNFDRKVSQQKLKPNLIDVPGGGGGGGIPDSPDYGLTTVGGPDGPDYGLTTSPGGGPRMTQ